MLVIHVNYDAKPRSTTTSPYPDILKLAFTTCKSFLCSNFWTDDWIGPIYWTHKFGRTWHLTSAALAPPHTLSGDFAKVSAVSTISFNQFREKKNLKFGKITISLLFHEFNTGRFFCTFPMYSYCTRTCRNAHLTTYVVSDNITLSETILSDNIKFGNMLSYNMASDIQYKIV
jgi:hypothetical protein